MKPQRVGRIGRAAALAAFALLSTACYSTTLRSGAPAGRTAPGYDARWHGSFVFGAVEGDPYDLSRICPDGWSEVTVETSFLQGALHLLTLFVYTPDGVTVVCAARPGDPTAAPGEGILPR